MRIKFFHFTQIAGPKTCGSGSTPSPH